MLAKRDAANCLICHSIKDQDLRPGDSAPALDGVGAALTVVPLRFVGSRLRADHAWCGNTQLPSLGAMGDGSALSAAAIKDVVARLSIPKKHGETVRWQPRRLHFD